MNGFKRLLMKAQLGDSDSLQSITDMYQWLIVKESVVDGEFDEDLMQILYNTLLNCLRSFRA